MENRTPFRKLLIANRGEIAVRVMRSARAMGIATVAVYSDADRDAEHVRAADEAVRIGGNAPADSYLRIDRIIEAAQATGAGAIHPGYGFLAENPALPKACAEAGIVFVGPSPDAIASMGDKAAAKALMKQAGVPCVPGYAGDDQSPETLAHEADRIGYPVMIKATAGGGGRGMRLVEDAANFADSLTSAVSEALTAFGDGTVLLEKAIVTPRHVEIQIMADRHGNVIHLGERDCSVQRRHQKIIEEAPSPAVDADLRARMGEISVKAAQAIGYEGAGTFEYLLDAGGNFYFMEMNTRLQVEHPVTEAITGLDLVALQLQVARGETLPLTQAAVTFTGHAIEVRLCAEDPAAGFMPQSGQMALWNPSGILRVDHALRNGAEVPPFYDSMIAKLIAFGTDRGAARQALMAGLDDTLAMGVRTNQTFLGACLAHEVFASGAATTAFIADHMETAPDTEDETEAALILAALLRAGEATGLAHGFPTPLRLARDDRTYTPSVQAHAHGDCVVTHHDTTRSVRVLHRNGGQISFETNGTIRQAHLQRIKTQIWLQLGGRSWDFDDLTFVPEVTADAASDGKVRASMNGTVVSVTVAVGDTVAAGDTLFTLEAMKMEHAHTAPCAGTVSAVHALGGDQVVAHAIIVELAD